MTPPLYPRGKMLSKQTKKYKVWYLILLEVKRAHKQYVLIHPWVWSFSKPVLNCPSFIKQTELDDLRRHNWIRALPSKTKLIHLQSMLSWQHCVCIQQSALHQLMQINTSSFDYCFIQRLSNSGLFTINLKLNLLTLYHLNKMSITRENYFILHSDKCNYRLYVKSQSTPTRL